MKKALLAAAAAATAVLVNNEYRKAQLGKELWAQATDQPVKKTS